MKRFTKVLISMLLLVSMLAGYIPALDFTTTANAATEPTYEYVRVTNPTPGKQYLILSGANSSSTATSAYALGVANNTAEGGNTTTKTVQVANNKVAYFEGAENYEWNILQGQPYLSFNGTPIASATYMFQNVATGGYLYNPIYYKSYGSDHVMKVTYTPLEDNDPRSTRMVFYKGVDQSSFIKSSKDTTVTQSPQFIQFDTPTGDDPNVIFNMQGINASSYPQVSFLYHNQNISSSLISRLFFSGTNLTYDGTKSAYWATGTTADNWVMATANLSSVAPSELIKWYNNTSYWNSNRTINTIRYDYLDGISAADNKGKGIWVDSIIFFKNAHARLGVTYQRWMRAYFGGGGGLYPSHKYPWCQFGNMLTSSPSNLTSNLILTQSGINANNSTGTNSWLFYYGFQNSNFVGIWEDSSGLLAPNYYEKRLVSGQTDSPTWTLVTSNDDIKNGEEYILCSAGSESSNARIIHSPLTTPSGKTVNAFGTYTSTVNAGDKWRIIMQGDYFYLQNSDTGKLLVVNPSGTVSSFAVEIEGQAAPGTTLVPYNYDMIFSYDVSTHTLTAIRRNSNGETSGNCTVGFNGTTFFNAGNIYLYKKTYCPHTNSISTITKNATCTEDGVRTYTCGATSMVWTFPKDNYYHPIAVGNQDTYFDVEMDIKILDILNNGNYGGLQTGWSNLATAPLFTQDGVGVGTEKIPETYNVGQWYHVKWDVSDNGTTTIYVDDVNVGIVNAIPTLYDGTQAFWKWDRISIDNLKIGNYFCDMENGLTGRDVDGQGKLVKDTTVEGCGTTWTETIPALGHSYTAVVTPPTCTAKGYTTHTCSVCSDSYTDAYTDELGHKWNDGVITSEPTCTEAGVKTYTCGGTSKVWTCLKSHGYNSVVVGSQGDSFDIEMDIRINADSDGGLKHNPFNNNSVGMAPVFTQTTLGVGTTMLSKTFDFKINTWYHVKWESSGDSTTIYVDGVNYGTVAAKPTLYDGNTAFWVWEGISIDNLKVGTYFCDMENGLEGIYSDAQGYSETVDVVNGCGATYTEAVSALGHDFDNSTDYLYQGNGTHSVKCTRCDVYSEAVACTLSYTSDGNSVDGTHSATCSVCGGTVTAAHEWEETKRTGDCGHDGFIYYSCSVCGETRTEEVKATGEHNYVATVTEHTCTEQGYTTHTCSKCNDTYVDDVVAALGHDYLDDDGWTVVSYPTFDAPGSEERVCRRCGAVEQREIPQLTQTTLAASNETTTPGGTATVTFKLTGNPGIWSQNFVIYFPKALTVESVTASTAVYSNYDMGQTSTGIIPTTNPRMLEYFNAAKIPDSSKYKAIAYYTDNGNEDSHADGLIVSVTFRVPEAGKCLKHYDVNLFGVFADNGNDAVNWNGDSINPAIVYKNGGIDIPDGIGACATHQYGEWTVKAEPTCTSKGMKERECSVCGYIDVAEIDMLPHTWVEATCTEDGYCSVCGTVNPDAPALGHLWGDWITVREASGISPEIQKRYCQRKGCNAFETQESAPAIGTGYSEYAGDELTYKYYLTDTVTPGHEYVIVNSNTAGAAKSLTDINTAISSQNITVENDGTGLFVSPSADSYIWNTTGTEEGVLFANKSSGKFLKAYGETDTPNISLNVTSSDNPFGSNAFMFNPNGYVAKSGYYLGYKSDITVQESTGGTGAAPSGDIMVLTGYLNISSCNSTMLNLRDNPFCLEFDFSFGDDDSNVCIKNPSFQNTFHISNSTKKINLCGSTSNPIDASLYLLGGTGYTLWNHCKIEVANGYMTVTLNGHQFDSYRCGDYVFGTALTLHTYDLNNKTLEHKTAYDNFSITVDGTHIGTMTDGIDYGNGKMSGGLENDGNSPSFENATLPSNWSNGSTTTTTTYATDVFTASNDSSDKVYFYEKRPVGDVIEVYELVDDITAGETYVLVDANEAGSAKLLASDATASSATVYSDGISYTPYVLATADQEYTVVKAGNGYIFNNINDSFLSQNGLTGSLTADNVLECENGAVTVKGNTYYLYKKTQITVIDTGLASDFAVVDFGTGITVGADDVRAFRNNDTYSDRVDVSLSALVTDDDGLIKNNKFYKYNLASDKLAAANGEGVYVLDKSGVGTLSLTLGEGATLRFVPTSANYETVQTFTYQCTVDRIGAYMYADLKIIPATTIYYEDNREGFITYTDGTYPDAEHGAKWETVETDAAINTLFGDEKVYGYTDDYTSYLMFSGNSAHKIRVSSSQITSGTNWMPTATFTFTGTGFDLISATSGSTTLVTLEITNTDTSTTKKIAMNSYFGYQYIPADNETGTPASWEPVAKDDTVAMYQVPIVRWRGNYGNYSVKVIPTYNKIMDVAKLGYSDFYLDAVRVYNPIDVSDAANADVKSQYQADKELVSYEANLRRLLIPKDSVIPGESSSVSGVVFTDGNGLTRTVNTYTDYTNPIANNEIIVPAGTGVSFALNAADGTVPERILLGAKVSAGVGTDESVELVVSGGGEPKTIRLGTSTDMYYDITDAIKWNGTTTETITIYNRGIEGKDPHISLTNIKFTSGSETASLSSLNFFVSAAMEADTYKVLAEEFGVELVYGDIDGDGTVNTVDSKLIKKQMLGLIELAGYDYEAGDIDGDGEISSKDVKLLMKMLLTD